MKIINGLKENTVRYIWLLDMVAISWSSAVSPNSCFISS
jgi:hypothetical protein